MSARKGAKKPAPKPQKMPKATRGVLRGRSFSADAKKQAKREAAETKAFKAKVDAIGKAAKEPAPARGARTKAKERAAVDAKVAKRAKTTGKKLAKDGKPAGQRDLFGEPLPPAPPVSLVEREIIQRLATTGHFKASIDGDDMEELRTAGTFLQRRAIVRGKMKALATVEEIPHGAKDAECDEIVRAFERQYILKEVPYDMGAAAERVAPPPIVKEREVIEHVKPVPAAPKSLMTCPACDGAKELATTCPDPRCKDPLYAHDCKLGGKKPCATCSSTGKVPCSRCNGNADVEWMPEAGANPTIVACPKCRPKEHAKDLEELHPCSACDAPKLQHVGPGLTCPEQVNVKDGGPPRAYDAKKGSGEIAFPQAPADTEEAL